MAKRNIANDRKADVRLAMTAITQALKSCGPDDARRAYGQAIHDDALGAYLRDRGVEQSGIYVEDLLDPDVRAQIKRKRVALQIPGSDHESGFSKDGKPYSIVFHPYEMLMGETLQLASFCQQYGLRFDIYAGSWHFPHATIMVEIRSAKVKPLSTHAPRWS